MSNDSKQRPSTHPSLFALTLGVSVGLTLMTGAVSLRLAESPTLTPAQERLFETSRDLCQMGGYGIFGLLSFGAGKRMR